MKYNKKKDISFLFQFLKKKKWPFIFSTIADNAIVSICYNIVLAVILKNVIEGVETANHQLFLKSLWIAAVSFLVAFIFEPVVWKMNLHCVRDTMKDIRQAAFGNILTMSVSTFEEYESGDLLTRVVKDTDDLENIYSVQIQSLCFALIHGVVAMGIMFYYQPFLAAVSILLGILAITINAKISTGIGTSSSGLKQDNSEIGQMLFDTVNGYDEIKMSCAENFYEDKFRTVSKDIFQHEKKIGFLTSLLEFVNHSSENLNQVGLMIAGIYMAFRGYTTIGVVVAVLRLQGNASYLFSNLSNFLADFNKLLPCAKRIVEILENSQRESECVDLDSVKMKSRNLVHMEEVEFAYQDGVKILDKVNLDISQGQSAAIIGESGNGKTTLIKLLLGFYQPAKGVLSIGNGKHVDKSQIAYVDQKSYLFELSIKDNIRIANQNATDQEIENACKLTGAHEFILNLENGYDTIVAEDSRNLSGGQRQRIALARAVVSGRPIMLLDEVTSELDEKGEAVIGEMIQSLKGKRTILLITHKKSLLDYVEKAYQLENGKLANIY